MKRFGVKAAARWAAASPFRDYVKASALMHLCAVAILIAAATALGGPAPRLDVLVGLAIGAGALIWGCAIVAFLLSRAAMRLIDALDGNSGRAEGPPPAPAPESGGLWDPWLDESPDLFR